MRGRGSEEKGSVGEERGGRRGCRIGDRFRVACRRGRGHSGGRGGRGGRGGWGTLTGDLP